MYEKMKLFKSFMYTHLTSNPSERTLAPPITNINCHILLYGTSCSGKTSFSKYYLNQTKPAYLVFERDENEWSDTHYIDLL